MTTSLAQPPTSYSDHSIMRPSYSDSSPMDYRTPRTTPHFPLHRDSAPAPRPIPPNLTSLPSIHAMVGSIDRPLPPSHTSSPINPTRHRRPSVSSIAGPGFPPSRDSFPAPSSAAPAPPSLYVPRTGADRPTFDASADASPSSAHPSNYAASSFRDDRRYDDRSAYTRYSPARNELVDRTRPGSQGAPGPAYMPHGVPTPPSQPPNSIAGPPPARYGAPSHYPAGQMPLPMAYPGANGYDAAGRAQVVEGHLQNWDYRDLLRRTINAGHTITNFCEHYIRVADEQSGTPTIMSRMPNEREVSEMLNNIDMMRQSLTGIRQHIAERNTLRPEESHTPPRGHAETRKRRGRAAPPGRCHSCSRIDTPEWRRGPDGARTLCNACGLHYAKLERKRLSEQRFDSSKGN